METSLIIQVAIIGIITALLALTLKREHPELSLLLMLGGSIAIFFRIIPALTSVIDVLRRISGNMIFSSQYISIILKVIGIAYIAEFGAQICLDDGETAIASKIELAGKVLIMYVSAPILLTLIDVIVNMLP